MPESGLIKGRVWLIDDTNTQLQHVLYSMDEPFLTTPPNTTSSSFLSLLNTLSTLWYAWLNITTLVTTPLYRQNDYPFLLILDEGHTLLSALIRAYVFGPSLPCNFFQFSNHMIEGVARKLLVYNEEENDQLTQSQDIICKGR